MVNYKLIQFNLNKFFKKVYLKKQYAKKMQDKVRLLNKLEKINYRKVGSKLFKRQIRIANKIFIIYVIDISFSKKNTLVHVNDCSGNTLFFYSAGFFQKKNQEKISRALILKKFYKLLISRFKFLRGVPIAIHFKNTDSNIFWFLKRLKKKLFIVLTKHFNSYPYNGCRKRKIRRKKSKSEFLSI